MYVVHNFRSEILLSPTGWKKTSSQNKEQHFTDVHGLPCIENLVCSADETPEPITTTITGNIPSWIKGNFLRNGPGKFEIGRSRWVSSEFLKNITDYRSKVNETLCLLLSFNHWFDGMALLHQFHIEDGKVTYMSRFLNSDCYKENLEHNRIMVSEFGTIAMPDPCKNFFQRFLSRFELPSECEDFGSDWSGLNMFCICELVIPLFPQSLLTMPMWALSSIKETTMSAQRPTSCTK